MQVHVKAREQTEAFSQVMLMVFQTVSLTDLELTCNYPADLQGLAFVHLLSSGITSTLFTWF